jgi:adenylate kinase family enzyme
MDQNIVLQRCMLRLCLSCSQEVISMNEQNNTHQLDDKISKTRELSEKILTQVYKNDLWQKEVINAINRSHEAGRALGDVKEYLGTREYDRFKEELLVRLRFIEMTNRVFAIGEAYEQTYEWIFDEKSGDGSWSNFVDWLQSDKELYWVTGKPGAGKSTLCKFILNDPRTIAFLQNWAGGQELFLTAFYFWNSGTDMQMSQEGLVRTLLHHALREMPEYIPAAFANRMEMFLLFDSRMAWQDDWEFPELAAAFQAVVREVAKTRKIAIFIDGLDEYHGNHMALIKFIQGLIGPHVKICVSSRPWNVFQDAFMHKPSLRLEDLTYHDIYHYVSSNFAQNPGFATLEELDPEYAKELIKNVTKKASGVFLWVQLVTHSLLEGLSNGERLTDLQRRVDDLPPDLERLFENILYSLDTFHFARASQLLQIIRSIYGQPDVLTLSFADEDDPELPFNMPIEPLEEQQKKARAELMRRRINACFKGLVEVSKRHPAYKGVVSYLHRTVRDFIEREDIWNKLLSATEGTDFDPSLRLAAAYLVGIKTFDPDDHAPPLWSNVFYVIEYVGTADPHCNSAQMQYLKELDRACAIYTTTPDALNTCYLDRYKAESWDHPAPYWTATRRGTGKLKSFTHFAVYGKLTEYLTATLSDQVSKLESKEKASLLNELMQIAREEVRPFDDVPTFAGDKIIRMRRVGKDEKILSLLRALGAEEPPLQEEQSRLDRFGGKRVHNALGQEKPNIKEKKRSKWRDLFGRSK